MAYFFKMWKFICFLKPFKIYFSNSPKKGFRFLEYIKQHKKSDIKNLIYLFLFHGISFDILDKRKKIGGHQNYNLSGGPNFTPPPQISKIIQYKTLRSVFFFIYIIPYYLYEVILHYKMTKEKKNL